jgi:hypothetical protein
MIHRGISRMSSSSAFLAGSRDELQELQEVFFSILRNELNENDKIFPDTRIEQLIAPNAILTSFDRMELYAQQYWWRLLQSLESDFPLLRRVLGVELFSGLIRKYLVRYPSNSYTLRHLGRRLPEFIKSESEIPGEMLELAWDISRFELFRIESFFAKDASIITEEEMSVASPEDIQLALQPHVFLLFLSHPLHEYLSIFNSETLKDNQTNAVVTKEKNPGFSEIRIPKEKTSLIIYRYSFEVFAKKVSDMVFDFLSFLSEKTKSLDQVIMHYKDISENDIFSVFNDCSRLKLLAISKKGIQ